ncbi:glycosyltransferase [Patescibacteria group bacterium]|nr:glycosyltransferase [Patescibacteria group bacterium]
MKIGIVTNLYPPYVRGGAEHVVVRTVEALTEMEQEVFVVSTQPRNVAGFGLSIDERTMERIYRFFPMNLYYILRDHYYPWIIRFFWHSIDTFLFNGAWMLNRIMAREEPDIMITHNLKGMGFAIPRVIAKKKIPHVHVVHDLQLIYPSGLIFFGKEKLSLVIRPFYWLYQIICKYKFGSPDVVIFPSTYLKNEYISRGFFPRSDVIVMPNPAPRFTDVSRTEHNDNKLRLLFVGQLEHHKGIDFLLEAIKDQPDIQLIIAGEGTLIKKVKKYADENDRIVYLGYIAVDQLVNCFALSDALIVPSLCYENSPTVIYESFKAGVPVLASDIGGVGELVENGKNGFLFTPGDKADLLRVIDELRCKKDKFVPEEIKKTIAPYELAVYGEALLKKLFAVANVSEEPPKKVTSGEDYLGKEVTVTVNRPIGSLHPIYNFRFTQNFGHVPDTLAGDHYPVDAFVLGVDRPISHFTGKCIGFVRRLEENNDRLIVVPEGRMYTAEEIRAAVEFEEQYTPYTIILADHD